MSTLRFLSVTKRFDGRTVLDGLDAELPLTESTYVVGRSGGGKSVLCRLAVGLVKPDEGEIHLGEHAVHAIPRRQLVALRRAYPYVVQGPALLDWLTLEENVALADRRADKGRVREALAHVGLSGREALRPPQVSPGVAKRAALARALLLRPRYLLLDEPTTGLDQEAAGEVNAVLEQLRQEGLGSLVVSHDYPAVRRLADRVVVVARGKVVFHGTPAQFEASTEPEVRALTAPGDE